MQSQDDMTRPRASHTSAKNTQKKQKPSLFTCMLLPGCAWGVTSQLSINTGQQLKRVLFTISTHNENVETWFCNTNPCCTWGHFGGKKRTVGLETMYRNNLIIWIPSSLATKSKALTRLCLVSVRKENFCWPPFEPQRGSFVSSSSDASHKVLLPAGSSGTTGTKHVHRTPQEFFWLRNLTC